MVIHVCSTACLRWLSCQRQPAPDTGPRRRRGSRRGRAAAASGDGPATAVGDLSVRRRSGRRARRVEDRSDGHLAPAPVNCGRAASSPTAPSTATTPAQPDGERPASAAVVTSRPEFRDHDSSGTLINLAEPASRCACPGEVPGPLLLHGAAMRQRWRASNRRCWKPLMFALRIGRPVGGYTPGTRAASRRRKPRSRAHWRTRSRREASCPPPAASHDDRPHFGEPLLQLRRVPVSPRRRGSVSYASMMSL